MGAKNQPAAQARAPQTNPPREQGPHNHEAQPNLDRAPPFLRPHVSVTLSLRPYFSVTRPLLARRFSL